MKRFLKILIITMLLMVVFNVQNVSATTWSRISKKTVKIDKDLKASVFFSVDKTECWINKLTVNKNCNKVKIPKKIEGAKVTRILYESREDIGVINNIFGKEYSTDEGVIYKNNVNIREIILPDSISQIGKLSFAGLAGLEKIQLPQNLKEIEERTFFACKNLRTVSISKATEKIDFTSFYQCNSLQQINVSKDNNKYKVLKGFIVSKDGSKLYHWSVYTENIVIPSSVKELGKHALDTHRSHYVNLKLSVEKGNLYYASKNNCLYEKKTGKLVAAQASIRKEVHIPKEVKILPAKVIWGTPTFTDIYIPKTTRKWYAGWIVGISLDSEGTIHIEGNEMPKLCGKFKHTIMPVGKYYQVNKVLEKKLIQYMKKENHFMLKKGKRIYCG